MPRPVARVAVPVVAATVLAAGGAWALARPAGPGGAAGSAVRLADYTTAASCPQLLEQLRERAHPHVTAYGLDTAGPIAAVAVPAGAVRDAAGAAADPARAALPAPGPTSGTGTNVQVPGVDEADVSKRSGDLLLTVGAAGGGQGLTVLRTGAGGRAEALGRLATDWAPVSLLVDGDTALLLGPVPTLVAPDAMRAPGAVERPRPYQPGPLRQPRTRLAQVDLADPAHPRLVRTLDVDGDLVGARLAGGVVRLSVSAAPDRLPFVQPAVRGVVPPGYGAGLAGGDGGGRGTDLVPGVAATPSPDDSAARALAENRRVVDTSTIDQWLPQWSLTSATGGPTRRGRLLDCSNVGMPAAFSGLGVLALLTLNLHDGGVERWDGAGVVASGATLYATADRSYVTTTQWPETGIRRHTLVHAFGTGTGGVHYLGSGDVDGTLIGSSALDEYEGKLRVATTSGPVGGPAPAPGSTGASSSSVTVLELRDGRLQQVGRVDGLGSTEVIHAVRFAGPVGYVVTFRTTDPLYTLDLADAAHPRVAGQLHLLGYSAYLHPLEGGLLLGVGMDASAEGMRTGLQMSLFDVADPAHPRLLDRVAMPGTWAATEGDPHAFTYADGVALVPALGTPVPIAVEGSSDGAVSSPPPPDLGDGAVVAVRVQGRTLAAPRLLRLATGGAPGLDLSTLRTFAAPGTIWALAPGQPHGVLTAYDPGSLATLGTTRW